MLERACSSRRSSKMLANVGMVKTYSKSAHVNDLGFTWTGPPCCMDRLAPLFAWTGPPPCSYVFFARWYYLAGTHCTIPTSALVFGGNIFTLPCSYIYCMGCKLLMGQSTFNASKQQWQPTFSFSESWQGV